MPPNSKGGAFIHNPKVSGDVETKAQVKLKFRNTKGKTMVCTRSLQLTQKEKTQTMKTLETVLETQDERTGEVCSLVWWVWLRCGRRADTKARGEATCLARDAEQQVRRNGRRGAAPAGCVEGRARVGHFRAPRRVQLVRFFYTLRVLEFE